MATGSRSLISSLSGQQPETQLEVVQDCAVCVLVFIPPEFEYK